MDAGSRPGFAAVSTNPAIDRVARLEGKPGGVVRASELLETPGGKAIHTACVAAELGADATVITTAGGDSGELLLALLASEPLEVHAVPVAEPTRGTYTLVGAAGGDLVEVHEPGGALTAAECDGLVSTLAGSPRAPWSRSAAACPPGAPDRPARAPDRDRRASAARSRSSTARRPRRSRPPSLEGPTWSHPTSARRARCSGLELDPRPGRLGARGDRGRDPGPRRGRGLAQPRPEGSVFADAEGSLASPPRRPSGP